jgi:hypothetical protein
VRVPRPRGSEKAEPTIKMQDLQWGLRLGMFAYNGPSTGIGHNAAALGRRRHMRMRIQLAGGAGILLVSIAYGLQESTVRVPRHTAADPQIVLTERETRVAAASSSPPTSADFMTVSRPTLDAPVTAAQRQTPASSEQPRHEKMPTHAKRALEQKGAPSGANNRIAQPRRDRSVSRRIHGPHRGSITVSIKGILKMIDSFEEN